MSINAIKRWFEMAIPNPTLEHACIQVGCHLEEVAEMLEALGDEYDAAEMHDTATAYKTKSHNFLKTIELLSDSDKVELLDSIADQIVTNVGIAHMLGMDISGALNEVARSNFSKFEDGKPVFDANGKISKGKNYTPPNLKQFV